MDFRTRPEDMSSLWVGNVDPKEVTERQLTQLFSKYELLYLYLGHFGI